mgnify:CR=1 FL=1
MLKQLILAGVFFLFMSSGSALYAQTYMSENNVPILVTNSFYDNSEGAYDIDKDVQWINDFGNTYTAEYHKDGKINRITYDEKGSIVRTETQIEGNTLPYIIRDTFISSYPDVKIYYYGKIDDPIIGTLYRVGYSEADAKPDSPKSYIYYKEDGTIHVWE